MADNRRNSNSESPAKTKSRHTLVSFIIIFLYSKYPLQGYLPVHQQSTSNAPIIVAGPQQVPDEWEGGGGWRGVARGGVKEGDYESCAMFWYEG